jgi:hypothetical protein
VASQGWINLLNAGAPWQTTNGTALTSSASAATISPQAPTGQDFVLPGQPGGLQFYTGMSLRIRAGGTLQAGSTTSNLTVFLAAGVSGTLGTTITTAVGWQLEALIRVLAIGSTGNTLTVGGVMEFPTAAGSNTATLGTANNTILNMPETVTAFNTYTAATALGLRATLSAAFGSVQCNQFTIEQMC